jgi:RNA polymerase sigma factor (sigma-70 family)
MASWFLPQSLLTNPGQLSGAEAWGKKISGSAPVCLTSGVFLKIKPGVRFLALFGTCIGGRPMENDGWGNGQVSEREAAFLRLLSENETKLIKYVARLLRAMPSILRTYSAEEIVQNVLGPLSVRENFNPNRPDAIVYVRLSIYRYILNLLRDSKKARSLDHPSSLGTSMGADGPLSSILIDPKCLDPADILNRSDLRQEVWVVLDDLQPHYRQVLVLYYIEQVGTWDEVASAMNISSGILEGIVYRARTSFAEAFERRYGVNSSLC